MFRLPSGPYFSACLGSLFLSILCRCCSHFFWHCFISFTMSCAPVFPLIHWFFSLSNFVIPSKCLKYFICAASKCFSSLFFSTQTSLPNFDAALAVMLWILNFVSLFICFPKSLLIAPFILLYVCNLSSKSLLYSDIVKSQFSVIHTKSWLFLRCILSCDVMWTDRSLPTFQANLPAISGYTETLKFQYTLTTYRVIQQTDLENFKAFPRYRKSTTIDIRFAPFWDIDLA